MNYTSWKIAVNSKNFPFKRLFVLTYVSPLPWPTFFSRTRNRFLPAARKIYNPWLFFFVLLGNYDLTAISSLFFSLLLLLSPHVKISSSVFSLSLNLFANMIPHKLLPRFFSSPQQKRIYTGEFFFQQIIIIHIISSLKRWKKFSLNTSRRHHNFTDLVLFLVFSRIIIR